MRAQSYWLGGSGASQIVLRQRGELDVAGLLAGKRSKVCAATGLSRDLACEPFGNDMRRDGPAEAKALQRVHAGRAQEEMLLCGFDAFGRHFHPQSAPEAHDRMDDR